MILKECIYSFYKYFVWWRIDRKIK